MVRYSFLVGLFHPLLHAGLSRRLRSLAFAAQLGVPLRSDFLDSPEFLRIYHFHVAHPKQG